MTMYFLMRFSLQKKKLNKKKTIQINGNKALSLI